MYKTTVFLEWCYSHLRFVRLFVGNSAENLDEVEGLDRFSQGGCLRSRRLGPEREGHLSQTASLYYYSYCLKYSQQHGGIRI